MQTKEFIEYVADKLKMDPMIIRDYFDEFQDPFVVANKLINEENILPNKLGSIYASYLGLAYVDPNSSLVDEKYVNMLGSRFVHEFCVLPLYKFGKAVTVATAYPRNPYLQDKLEKKLGEFVSFVFCFPSDVEYYMTNNGVM